MAKEIARGELVWKRIDGVPLLPLRADLGGGGWGTVPAFMRLNDFVYLTNNGRQFWYTAKDSLWEEDIRHFRALYKGAILAAAAKRAAWVEPTYRAMVAFALAFVPSKVKIVVNAFATTAFFAAHAEDIADASTSLQGVASALKDIARHSPRLAALMLCVAAEEAAAEVTAAIRKEGLAKVVYDNLDLAGYAKAVASLLGAVLKLAVAAKDGEGLLTKPAGWATMKGLARLKSVAGKVYEAFKLAKKVTAVTSGPRLDNTEQMAASLVAQLGEAGVRVSAERARAAVAEAALDDPKRQRALELLRDESAVFETAINRLSTYWEKEMF